MKAVQTWVFLAALVAVIFVVTLLSQSLSNSGVPEGSPDGTAQEAGVAKLNFPVTSVDEVSIAEITPYKGTRSFWFENPNPVPLEVSIERVTCKCTKVEVLTFKKDEEKVFDHWQKHSALLGATASEGVLSTLVAAAATDEPVRGFIGNPDRWTSLMYKQGEPAILVPVPAGGRGLVRLTWEGKEPGAQRLKATLLVREPGQPKFAVPATLEAPVRFVSTLHVDQLTIDVNEIQPGTEKSALFPCFSPTRHSLRLQARERNGDPCFECSVRPMTDVELEFFQRQRTKESALPVLSAYLVFVKVRERSGDKQLDLGPFEHQIMLTSDETAETYALAVKGVVMGEVRVLGDSAKHRVDLGQFDGHSGSSVHVVLEADRPTIKLDADSHYPEFLQVKLGNERPSPAGGRQWDLDVNVPPDKAFGRLPADSVVVLKTQDSPPRRLRIPVIGHATTR